MSQSSGDREATVSIRAQRRTSDRDYGLALKQCYHFGPSFLHLDRAYRLFVDLRDSKFAAWAALAAGNALFAMGSYRDADTYYRRALEYFPADDPWRPEAELGHVICVMSQADASVDLEAHLVKLTQTGQTDFRRRALHVLGVWRRTQGRYAAAMEVLDTTLSLGGPSVDMQFISSQTEMMLCYLLIGENAKAKTILRDLWPHVKYAHPIDVAALTTAALALQVRLGEGVAIPCFTDYEGRWEALVNWAWRKHGLTERYDPLP